MTEVQGFVEDPLPAEATKKCVASWDEEGVHGSAL